MKARGACTYGECLRSTVLGSPPRQLLPLHVTTDSRHVPPPLAVALQAPPMARTLMSVDGDMRARVQQAAQAAALYRSPPSAFEWAEGGWLGRTPARVLRDGPNAIAPPSALWAEYAEWLAAGGWTGAAAAAVPAGELAGLPCHAVFCRKHEGTHWWCPTPASMCHHVPESTHYHHHLATHTTRAE